MTSKCFDVAWFNNTFRILRGPVVVVTCKLFNTLTFLVSNLFNNWGCVSNKCAFSRCGCGCGSRSWRWINSTTTMEWSTNFGIALIFSVTSSSVFLMSLAFFILTQVRYALRILTTSISIRQLYNNTYFILTCTSLWAVRILCTFYACVIFIVWVIRAQLCVAHKIILVTRRKPFSFFHFTSKRIDVTIVLFETPVWSFHPVCVWIFRSIWETLITDILNGLVLSAFCWQALHWWCAWSICLLLSNTFQYSISNIFAVVSGSTASWLWNLIAICAYWICDSTFGSCSRIILSCLWTHRITMVSCTILRVSYCEYTTIFATISACLRKNPRSVCTLIKLTSFWIVSLRYSL